VKRSSLVGKVLVASIGGKVLVIVLHKCQDGIISAKHVCSTIILSPESAPSNWYFKFMPRLVFLVF